MIRCVGIVLKKDIMQINAKIMTKQQIKDQENNY